MQDARAYCRARKARLPREWEWQLAAQGRDGRRFPWGNELPTTVQGTHIPIPTKGNVAGAAADVDAHPAGASIFGAEDMVGNVWQVRVLTYLLTKFLARNPYLLTIYRNPYLLTYLLAAVDG